VTSHLFALQRKMTGEPQVLNHDLTTYLAVTLSPSASTSTLADPIPVEPPVSVAYLGTVGQLSDVHLLGIPKEEFRTEGTEILDALREREGVVRVEVVAAPQTKRKRDEF